MAKRFTDTEKWHRNKWFRRLPRDGKLFWQYLCDCCDHAGIWEVDWEDVEYCLGPPVDIKELTGMLGKRRIELARGEKWFLPTFVDFQYGQLDEKNRVHISVIRILKKEGAFKTLISPLQGSKDKDKDKDKDKNSGITKGILAYLNEKTGKHFRKVTPELLARLQEFSVADCKRVIDIKTAEWFGGEWAKHLNPVTLFRPANFEKYLNQDINATPQPPDAEAMSVDTQRRIVAEEAGEL